MSEAGLKLNTIKSADNAKKQRKRVGRGGSSGKTCGRGHKGQKSRAGSRRRIGFEGGQMPLQRRLPKIGFRSAKSASRAEVRLHELSLVKEEVINHEALVKAKVICREAKKVKVILSGKVDKAFKLKGLAVTAGAREAIEAAGGSIED